MMTESQLGEGALMRGTGFILPTLGYTFTLSVFSWSASTQRQPQAELITWTSAQDACLFPSTLVFWHI
jgi:hypothetical protein